jgi:hypothetical protein
VNSAQQLAAFLLEDEGAWDFTTKIDQRHVSVSGEQSNWYLRHADCVVNWHLDMDVRSWGLKEANPIIKSIAIRLEYEVDNELEGGQNAEETIEINYPSATSNAAPTGDVKAALLHYGAHVQAEVEWQSREERSGMIAPVDVEVDLRTEKITVFF